MIEYLLLFCILVVFSSSYYLHFCTTQHNILIGYTGIEHPRLFEQQYGHETADLIVFKRGHFRSTRMQFAPTGTARSYLQHYQHLLLVHHLQPQVPLIYDTSNTIQYVRDNVTIAELWHQQHTGQLVQFNL